jgi:tetratricopeptide (TPR) repeat protein
VTATLPLAVAIAFWWKRGRFDSPTFWKSIAPFLVLGAVAGGTTAWLEAHHVGAKGADWSLSAVERVLVAGRAVWFYAWKIAWPADLVFIYPRWRIDAGNPLQYIPPLAAAATVFLLWLRKDRLGRGPLAAACYFGVTLAPALGFLNVYPMRYSFVADHFQYLASIGLLTLVAAATTRMTRRWEERAGRGATVAALGAAILVSISLAGLSWRQAAWYKDARTLWEYTAVKNPSATVAHWNLVELLGRANRREDALRHLLILQKLTPEDPEVPFAIGSLFNDLKKYRTAIPWFEGGLRLRPREIVAMNGLGDAYSSLGEYAAAERWYRQAAGDRSATDNEIAYACEGLGVISVRTGRTGEARRWFEDGLRAAPNTASLHYNLAILLGETGHVHQAASEYLEALRIDPGHLMARMNLAEEYAKSGDSAKAAEGFREIERRNAGKAEALFARGRLLEMAGRAEDSKVWFQRALEAPTEYPQIRGKLDKRLRR